MPELAADNLIAGECGEFDKSAFVRKELIVAGVVKPDGPGAAHSPALTSTQQFLVDFAAFLHFKHGKVVELQAQSGQLLSVEVASERQAQARVLCGVRFGELIGVGVADAKILIEVSEPAYFAVGAPLAIAAVPLKREKEQDLLALRECYGDGDAAAQRFAGESKDAAGAGAPAGVVAVKQERNGKDFNFFFRFGGAAVCFFGHGFLGLYAGRIQAKQYACKRDYPDKMKGHIGRITQMYE